jgi:hypothetical protein
MVRVGTFFGVETSWEIASFGVHIEIVLGRSGYLEGGAVCSRDCLDARRTPD